MSVLFDWGWVGQIRQSLSSFFTAGPGSSTDNAVVRWDGTGGYTLQNSVVTIGDTGVMAGSSISLGTNTITGTLAQFNTAITDADIQPLDGDLTALAANSTDGFWAHTAADTGAARTLAAPAAGFTITNPAGIAGNPTFVLANDLSALEGLASTGIAVRSAADTWVQRTITGTAAEITVADGSGAAANPTLSLPAALTFTGKEVTGGTFTSIVAKGTWTASGTWTIPAVTVGGDATFGTSKHIFSGATTYLYGSGTDIVQQYNAGAITYTADATNRVIFGHTAGLTIGALAHRAQIIGATSASSSIALGAFAVIPRFDFYRSNNAAIGSATVVGSGDILGAINWWAAQQTGTFATQTRAAQIKAEVDGTVTDGAAGDMPGRIAFGTTADGGSDVTVRLYLDSAGVLKPAANDGVALGTTALGYSDLFGATGFVFKFNNTETITHAASNFSVGAASWTLAAGTTAIGPLVFTSGTNLTTATAGVHEYNGTNHFLTNVASQRGVLPSVLFASNGAGALTLAADNSTQVWLNTAVDTLTVAASTTYWVRGEIHLVTGATTHTTALDWDDGTATFTSFDLTISTISAAAVTLATPQVMRQNTAASTVICATSVATGTTISFHGLIRFNGAGTFIPKLRFSANPTSTNTSGVNSFITLISLGSDTVAAVGNWG